MIDNRLIYFTCIDDDGSVSFEFDSMEMDAQEMFMKWVQFMNAIGYVLDPVEMERMWNGE